MKLNSTPLLPGAAVALVLLVAAPGAQAAPRPDLRVASVRPATAAAAIADGTALRLRIANKGRARAARTKTVLLLSRDARRSRDDVKVARVRTRAVRAKRRVTVRATLAVPAGIPAGVYRVVACADGARRVRERRERNNCAAAPAAITVGGSAGQTAPGSEPAPAPAPAPAPGSCAARPDLPDPASPTRTATASTARRPPRSSSRSRAPTSRTSPAPASSPSARSTRASPPPRRRGGRRCWSRRARTPAW